MTTRFETDRALVECFVSMLELLPNVDQEVYDAVLAGLMEYGGTDYAVQYGNVLVNRMEILPREMDQEPNFDRIAEALDTCDIDLEDLSDGESEEELSSYSDFVHVVESQPRIIGSRTFGLVGGDRIRDILVRLRARAHPSHLKVSKLSTRDIDCPTRIVYCPEKGTELLDQILSREGDRFKIYTLSVNLSLDELINVKMPKWTGVD